MRPLDLRARPWSTWKRPALNLPDCVRLPEPVALTISTVPFVVSRNDPTGTCRACASGTNVSPFWLARPPAARAAADGTPTSTWPLAAWTLTSSPISGGGRSSSVLPLMAATSAGVRAPS